MWIPLESADEFRRLCVDLFQWRALTVYVDGPEHDPRRMRHAYLVALATAELNPTASRLLELSVQVEGEDTPRPVDGWLANVRRGLLLGSAGSGKTTALRRYAAQRADALLDDTSTMELPVFVAARLLIRDGIYRGTLTRAIVPALDDETDSWLAQYLASEPAVLLIDGLDEIPRFLCNRLESESGVLAHNNAQLRVVLTKRAPSEVVGDWQRAELLPLQPSTVATWLRSIGLDVGEEIAWAATPLSLQLAADFARRRGDRPELDLTDLIGEIVDSRLGLWDMGKGLDIRGAWSLGTARNALAALAWRLADSPNETVLHPSGAELLDFVAERSGIIRAQPQDSSATSYGFTHRIFRDYFAGVWLAQTEASAEQLASCAADPTWQPAARHALRLLAPRELARAADKIWETADQEPAPVRWSMRTLVLRATMASSDHDLRTRFIELATNALHRAQQEAEREALWAPISGLLERTNQAPT
jgi:hypothetical protein